MGTIIYYTEKQEVEIMETKKKMGRPCTPEYTKKKFRYANIEKRFSKALEQMKDEHDKAIVLKVLEEMRA